MMFKFFLKKNFCDGWDNLFFLLFSNVIFVALAAGTGFLVRLVGRANVLALVGILIVSAGILMAVAFAWGVNARKIADFNLPSFTLFFRSLKTSGKTGFLFGVLLAVFFVIVFFAVAYYLALAFSGNTMGVFFTMLIAAFAIVCTMAFQWFVPLYFLQEENTFIKCLKKSFIIFFDNAGFSCIMLVYNLLLLLLSVISFLLLPGINGITLSNMNALRLRLYKYDWLEEHPDYMQDREKRADVPWDDLLAADKESLGSRTLRSFLFPWK